MILQYGGYAHADSECEVTIRRLLLRNDAQQLYGVRETWFVRGFLQAASDTAMTTAIASLKDAYSRQGQNLRLYLADGTTLSGHYLDGSSLLGGVKVLEGPSFPEGRGAEYAAASTFRTYEIVLEGEFALPDAPQYIRFNEVMSFSGGGPRKVFLQPIVGLPQKQQVASNTPFRVVQNGSAVGLFNWPSPPPPFWPVDEDIDQRRIEYASPDNSLIGQGAVQREFEVRWTYVFTAIAPIFGRPSWWF